MTNSKSTKGALFTSAISMLLCVSMLLGTTFAWFTDSVTSANNIIKSGNLDVELYYMNDETEGKFIKVAADTNVFKKNTLWEPGHTEVVKLKVVNEGSLDLKYQLGVNVASETGSKNVAGKDFKLSDYIKYGIVDGDQNYTRDKAVEAVSATANKLNVAYDSGVINLEDGKEKIVTLVVYMPTSVTNDANYAKDEAIPTINLGINLFATQLNSEEDSFGKDYDKDALYADAYVSTYDELQNALTDGADTISISAGTYTFPASSLSEGDVIICNKDTVFEGVSKLNIEGATVVGATFKNPNGSAADQTINGTFKNCTFTGQNGLRWCYAGETVVFENCVFDGSVYGVHFDGGANYVTFKNCIISGFNAMGGAITKTTFDGCTFVSNGKSVYNGINMWGDTDMKNCTFKFDGSCNYEWIDLCGADKTATFTDCVVDDGTNKSNISTLFSGKLTKREDSGKIIVDGKELL